MPGKVKKDGARDWARAKAQDILREYHPIGIVPDQDAEFSRIIAGIEKLD